MAIIRWNPWNMNSLLDDDWELPTIPGISRMMGQGLNIYETENAVVAEAAMPGIPEDKIDVSYEEGVVRVTGAIDEAQEEKDKRRYFMTSMARSFNYSFRLPQGLMDKEPTAELEDGVLKLTFAKAKKAPPKKITVLKKAKGK